MVINLKTKRNVREHFDRASVFYQELWGIHIHHGYYETGKESEEEAQEKLLKYVIDKLDVKKGSAVLDIGCGVAGTGIWLASNYGCNVVGFSTSPSQLNLAKINVAKEKLENKVKIVLDDADNIQLNGSFDYAIAIEVLSHLHDRNNFFNKISKLLKKRGRIAIAVWQRDVILSKKDFAKYIKPINFGMMVSLPTYQDYIKQFDRVGLRLVSYSDLNDEVSKTWDLGVKIINKPSLWKLAKENREHFVYFLKAFQSMRNGYKSGAFRYGVIVAEKI